MARTPRKTLGLAVQEGEILAVELRVAGTRRILTRVASFSLPAGEEFGDPAALGRSLASFLRTNGFSAKSAVIGLPAQWLMSKQLRVPPADEATLGRVLRIQAERAFSYDGKDLVIDYVSQEGPQDSVLLFAALDQRVEQVRAMAAAAGLAIRGITASATTLALASAPASGGVSDVVVQVTPGAVELAIRAGDRFRLVGHLPVAPAAGRALEGAAWEDALTNELRRVLAAASDEAGAIDGGQLILWDGVGISQETLDRMARRLSLTISDRRSLSSLAELNGAAPAAADRCEYAAAAALARAAVDTDLVAFDFTNSRLSPPRRTRFGRRMRAVTIVAAGLVLLVGVLGYEWYSASRFVGALERQVAEQTPTVEAAAELIEKVEAADGWFGSRPEHLECLLALSTLFPDDGGVWATHLTVPDDLRGIVSGKATDDRLVLEVIERLQGSPRFSEVKLHGGIKYPQRAAREQHVSFSVSFRFMK